MTEHDKLFKELITHCFHEFIEFVAPDMAAKLDFSTAEFLDKELFTDFVARGTKEVDLIAKVKYMGQDVFILIHVEAQGEHPAEFEQRMFFYFSRLFEKFRLPVFPIVIFYHDNPKPEPSEFNLSIEGRQILRFQYQTIQLNRMNWRDYVRNPNPVVCALMAKMGMAPEDRPYVKLECLRMITTLKVDKSKLRLISGFVDTYLRLNQQEDLIFKAEAGKLVEEKGKVMELVTSWMEEGIEIGLERGLERGRQEGRQEGRQDERLAIVLRQLRRRLGQLNPETEMRVCALESVRLEKLAEDLLDFSSLADLIAWMDH